MKNKLLLGLIGLGLFLPVCVNAEILDSVEEGNNSTNANVTVGEVEVPIYDVSISWDSLEFDWKYDYTTNRYNWSQDNKCTNLLDSTLELNDANWDAQKQYIYKDDTCSTKISNETTYDEVNDNLSNYFHMGVMDFKNIQIVDNSKGTEIVPSIEWTPDEKYSYTQGMFQYYEKGCQLIEDESLFVESSIHKIYTDSNCTIAKSENETTFIEGKYYRELAFERLNSLTSSELPEKARNNTSFCVEESCSYQHMYLLKLTLNSKDETSMTPKVGDTIGTVTITIKAVE